MSTALTIDLQSALSRNEETWAAACRLLYSGQTEEFLQFWTPDGRYSVAYPVPGLPDVVQGHDELRAMFGAFGTATSNIEVHDVQFHQTIDPDVVFVQERMIAQLHGGGTYENVLVIRVTFRDGLIADMLEYYGQRAHEDLLQKVGFGN